MDDQKKYPPITCEELFQKFLPRRTFVLIDTLPQEHFALVHLPGAANACVYEVTFLDQVKQIAPDRDTTLVIYGSDDKTHDIRAAADKLVQAGYKKLKVLNGGLAAWQVAGLPLEGDRPGEIIDPGTKLTLIDGRYEVDTEHSSAEWTGRNPNGKHFGTVPISEGDLVVEQGKIQGKFTVDLRSIENRDLEDQGLRQVLISHLQSEDFFLTRLFPQATFVMSAAEPLQDGFLSSPNFSISGALSLRGVQSALTFPATVVFQEEDTLTAEAHFDLDRTRWGIIYGSSRFFHFLGKHLVFDLISLEIRIRAKRNR